MMGRRVDRWTQKILKTFGLLGGLRSWNTGRELTHDESVAERSLYPVNDELKISASWPASTISGDPSIQELSMEVTRKMDGSALFTGMIGHLGDHPENCEHFQFVLGPDQVAELTTHLSPPQ
jgi:hypothetical protein